MRMAWVLGSSPKVVEALVKKSELVGLRDEFERLLLQQNRYPSGEIHGTWSEAIKKDFRAWLKNYPRPLAVSNEEIETYLEKENN